MKTKYKILVIDDEAGIRETLNYNLTSRGFIVETAESGSDALVKMKKMKFDAILSDIVMKDIDGVEFLEILRNKSIEIPVILFTGYASIESSVKAVNLKAFAYLKKPASIDEIEQTLMKAVDFYKSNQKKDKAYNSYLREIFRFKKEKKEKQKKDGLNENDIDIPIKSNDYKKIASSVIIQTRNHSTPIIVITKNKIIEDNITKLLLKEGFDNFIVTKEFNPEQCKNYSIALVDTQRNNGKIIEEYETLIKINPEIKFIPIVDNEKIKEKILNAGIKKILEKPVRLDVLLKLISWESYLAGQEKIKKYIDGMPIKQKIYRMLKYAFIKKIEWKYSAVILLMAFISAYVIAHPKLTFFIHDLKKQGGEIIKDSNYIEKAVNNKIRSLAQNQIEYLNDYVDIKNNLREQIKTVPEAVKYNRIEAAASIKKRIRASEIINSEPDKIEDEKNFKAKVKSMEEEFISLHKENQKIIENLKKEFSNLNADSAIDIKPDTGIVNAENHADTETVELYNNFQFNKTPEIENKISKNSEIKFNRFKFDLNNSENKAKAKEFIKLKFNDKILETAIYINK